MKKIIRLSTILLALLVLITSLSLSFTLHMCDGELEKISIFDSKVTCEMNDNSLTSKHLCCEEKQPKIDNNNKTKPCIEKDDCCENVTISMESNDFKNNKTLELSVETNYFLVAFYHSYVYTFEHKINRANSALISPIISPPNRQILYQTFLI